MKDNLKGVIASEIKRGCKRMNKEQIVALQKAQLEIMDEIHRICVKHNIRYYLVGGTGIGAVRHQGFIPWDIDIDIAMLRSDYSEFKRICEIELDPKYKYWDYHNTKNFTRPHALVSIKGTSLKTVFDKYNSREIDFGVFVDVLPLDNSPDNKQLQIKHGKRIKRIKMLKIHKLATCYDQSVLKKLVKEARRAILFFISLDSLNKLLDDEMQKYDNQKTNYVCSMAGKYPYMTECVPLDYFGNPQLVEFEHREYFAPEKIRDYLAHIYGDFMKLPPLSEQEASMRYFEEVQFIQKLPTNE